MSKLIRKILDNYAGVVITITLLAVMGLFVLFGKPFTSQPKPNKSASSSAINSEASIKGRVTITCAGLNCQTDSVRTAYDIVAYNATDKTSPVAQTQIDKQYNYTLVVPPGDYVIDTIPATSQPQHSISVKINQTVIENITIK